MATTKAKAAPAEQEEEDVGPELEEGTDPETGRDRNSSIPRSVDVDRPVTDDEERDRRVAALEREREGYVAAGKKDRVKAVDDDLKRLHKEERETTDGDKPEEIA